MPTRLHRYYGAGYSHFITTSRLRERTDAQQNSLWRHPLESGHVWQARFYDFVVFSEHRRTEKLRYTHFNPVKRGLVLEPQQWEWSSFRQHTYGEPGPVMVNEFRNAELKVRDVA